MKSSIRLLRPLLQLLMLSLPVSQVALAQESTGTEVINQAAAASATYEVPTDDEEQSFTQAQLDQLLAPVALYPDTILSHVLVASTYPLEVIQAARWSKNNNNPEGNAALEAVESQDWAPSVKALVQFPDLIQKMSEDLNWMQQLGDAFLQDETLVLATVQSLRQHARNEGSLDNIQHLQVSDDDGDIIIEPVTREVVYVPYYDTRVVYGPWWWPSYPPVHWHFARHRHRAHLGHSFFWGSGIYVGTGIYFSSFHWRKRHVVVVDFNRRHHYRYRGGRALHRHVDARRWRHNPRHRRGAAYRSARVRRAAFSDHRSQRRYATHRRDSDKIARRLRERAQHRSNERSRKYRSERRDQYRDQHRNQRRERREAEARQNHRRDKEQRVRREQRSREGDQRQRHYREGQRNQRQYTQHNSNNRRTDNAQRQARANERKYRQTSTERSNRRYANARNERQRDVRRSNYRSQRASSNRRYQSQRAHRSSGQRSRNQGRERR